MTDQPLVTFVLPFYNEEGFIGDTIASLARQTDRRFGLVLVNNGSHDRGEEEAREALRSLPDVPSTILQEDEPGKIPALARGIASVSTPLVGTMDADTIYPSGYVASVLRAFASHPDAVAVMALNTRSGGNGTATLLKRLQIALFPRRCHAGGCGQAFRTEAVRRAGSFDVERWPFVLEDHEIVHRLSRWGRLIYPPHHLCQPSDRRTDRGAVNWTPLERVLYKLLPDAAMNWFFYTFLARRFAKRGLGNLRLREQQWRDPPPRA